MPRKNVLKLIQGLRKSADALENNAQYDWDQTGHCNCGVLAVTMTNVHLSSYGSWTNLSHLVASNALTPYLCPVTRLKLKEVFDILLDNGMEYSDFTHLEYLSDPTIFKRAGIEDFTPYTGELMGNEHFTKRANVIKYMRAWADLLCENECKMKEQNAQ